ncbi:deoxyribonuclease-1-like [Argiope bruennichi]|uniref:Deoxyribonuclease-1 like protein n=1 Tax=Argiope bruennichi TaxID=94029 RepID=A0A8T0E9Z1_ARGBR|nr:deoxyribonuclease-1-like [Argiope bruennichi]KAF8767271.1 Deoxyribonuclease-1 like protein [Argiope bruennichi]
MISNTCGIILLLFCLCSLATCRTTWTNQTVERPVLVGAFNIQNLGVSKMSNKTVMDIVKKILLRYDLVLIQEIVTTQEELMENLVKDLNKLHRQKDSKYLMQISERVGRGNIKEQYAYIYRNDKFKFLTGHTFPDRKDDFMRPPYIAHFATPTLRDLDSMIVIGVHTQPKNAANETSAMAKVYDYAVKTFKVKDVMMMGDMNAGCANVRISDWDNIDVWRRKEFTWLITHDFDTTLSINCCPYDRIIIAGENMEDAVIWESAGAFKYRDLYGISTDMALAVSDHWPVEVKLRGGTSAKAKANLEPSLCLTIHDVRAQSVPEQLRSQKTTFGYEIESTEDYTELYSESKNGTALLDSLKTLQSKYQQLISKEAADAIVYKVKHGALNDATSHDFLEHELYSVRIYFDASDKTTTVHYCTATTVN